MNEPRTFIEFRPGMRRLIEDAIESLILLLDEIDGDDDLEDDDIEQDDPLEPDCCDHPADLGPPFRMDQTKQGEKVEASPPLGPDEAQAALRAVRSACLESSNHGQ
jgi:hypothetical protein